MKTEFSDTIAAVQSEYVTADAFFQSVIFSSLKDDEFRINCLSYQKNGKAAETYNDFFEWTLAYLKEYCTYIDPDDFTTL